jgi:hypothetical protein
VENSALAAPSLAVQLNSEDHRKGNFVCDGGGIDTRYRHTKLSRTKDGAVQKMEWFASLLAKPRQLSTAQLFEIGIVQSFAHWVRAIHSKERQIGIRHLRAPKAWLRLETREDPGRVGRFTFFPT